MLLLCRFWYTLTCALLCYTISLFIQAVGHGIATRSGGLEHTRGASSIGQERIPPRIRVMLVVPCSMHAKIYSTGVGVGFSRLWVRRDDQHDLQNLSSLSEAAKRAPRTGGFSCISCAGCGDPDRDNLTLVIRCGNTEVNRCNVVRSAEATSQAKHHESDPRSLMSAKS